MLSSTLLSIGFNNLATRLQVDLFSTVLKKDIAFFDKTKAGGLRWVGCCHTDGSSESP
jgi:hypothetical protein